MAIVRSKKKELVEHLIKLLNGDISPNDLMDYFEKNPKSLICFNKYARKKLYSTFDDVNEIKSKLFKKNIRVYVYQLVQGFLYTNKIRYTVGAEEYVLYNQMCNQCPEWFQKDFDLLDSLFTNLKELIKNNELNEKITSICKTTNGIYPEWLQNAEWPVINGIAYTFDSQTILPEDMDYDVDSITYSFINPVTNEKIDVVQFD